LHLIICDKLFSKNFGVFRSIFTFLTSRFYIWTGNVLWKQVYKMYDFMSVFTMTSCLYYWRSLCKDIIYISQIVSFLDQFLQYIVFIYDSVSLRFCQKMKRKGFQYFEKIYYTWQFLLTRWTEISETKNSYMFFQCYIDIVFLSKQ
jgi:hypothetical protein